MFHRAARLVAVLLSLAATGCAVQLVSPYDAQLAKDAAEFQTEFLTFVAGMTTKVGTDAAKVSANEDSYARLGARLTAMQSLSDLTQPPLDCAGLVARAQATAGRGLPAFAGTPVNAAPSGTDASRSCQTLLVVLVSQQLNDLHSIHALDCERPADAARCASIWGPVRTFGILDLSPDDPDRGRRIGRPVFFVLSATRALIYALNAKKPRAG